MTDGSRAMWRDAVLAVLVAVPLAAAAAVLPAPRSPVLFGAGAVGALVLELLLSIRTDRVRAVWADRRVRALAVVSTLGGTAVLVLVAGTWVVTVLLGGLCGYLVLLAGTVLRRRASGNR